MKVAPTKTPTKPLKIDIEDDPPTDWRSIYVANIVAALATVQVGSVIPTIWPYMKIVNPNMTETMYGAFRGASALGNIIASGVAGFWANRWRNTKPPLITGKLLNIFATCLYLLIEVKSSAAMFLFLFYDIFHGISAGFSSAYRTHISMASKEHERSRAFGLSMFAGSLGFLLGPLIQVLFTFLGYPGISLPFGFHLNLYTAPIYLALVTSGVGILFLSLWFNGKMRIKQKKIALSPAAENYELQDYQNISVYTNGLNDDGSNSSITKTQRPSDEVKGVKVVRYDKIAVFVLMAAKVSVELNMLAITSLMTPYSMAAFEWSSADSVTYMSAMMFAIGGFSMIFSVAYVFFKFDKIIPERIALVCSLTIFLLFFVFTFPWAFLSETMPYQHAKGETAYFNQTEAIAALAASNSTGAELVGCNVNYSWCATTPRINVYVYNAALVFAIGIGMPMTHVNLDILYSKMLGPIKQGVLQALFVSIGQVLNVIGPVIFTEIYSLSGPTYLWMFEIATSCIGVSLLLLNFHRMVSFTDRVERKVLKHGAVVS
uniref:MFS domain-containing protein n=1 Tax=Panagrellus redivivus TaxID=6233 RepID=A0A7E4W8M5_PANRE